MATIAKSSYGVQIKIGDGGGTEVFTVIGEVRDVTGPELSVGTEDVSAHDGGGWRDIIATIIDGGDVAFDINFNNATTQVALRTDAENRARRNFQLVIPTTVAKTLSFGAFVTNFGLGLPVEGVLSASVTLTISGAVVWT